MSEEQKVHEKGLITRILESPRYLNILRSIFTMAMLLSAYFLGMNAAYFTNIQIKEYCNEYNSIMDSRVIAPNVSGIVSAVSPDLEQAKEYMESGGVNNPNPYIN